MNTFLFFILGGNRFEVTLEKSNKNFSKKIQQVSDFLSRLTANLEFKIVHLCLLTSLCVFISLTVFFFPPALCCLTVQNSCQSPG